MSSEPSSSAWTAKAGEANGEAGNGGEEGRTRTRGKGGSGEAGNGGPGWKKVLYWVAAASPSLKAVTVSRVPGIRGPLR